MSELGTVADDQGNDVVVVREEGGVVVLWEPENGHTIAFPPAGRDKLRELLDRAAMPGQAVPLVSSVQERHPGDEVGLVHEDEVDREH